MDITTTMEVVEYATVPKENNQKNAFAFNYKSMVISFCDKHEEVLQQSEISKEDAIKLAKLILHIYQY